VEERQQSRWLALEIVIPDRTLQNYKYEILSFSYEKKTNLILVYAKSTWKCFIPLNLHLGGSLSFSNLWRLYNYVNNELMSLTRFLLPLRHLLSPRNLRSSTMEFQSSVGKLSSPLKDLVLSVTQNGSLHVGKQEKDEREVIEWIAKIEQGDLVNEPGLKVHPANMRVHIK
jgi:hypothetical protein